MYHLELRQFPHNFCRFNLSEREVEAILEQWVKERPIELGDRKWSPHQARLTVIEGPQLAPSELSMGRGWKAAQRQGEDVTRSVIDAAAAVIDGAASVHDATAPPRAGAHTGARPAEAHQGPAAQSPDALALGMQLGVQLGALLGPDPTALLETWRQVAAGSPALSPSESLAQAEAQLRLRSSASG